MNQNYNYKTKPNALTSNFKIIGLCLQYNKKQLQPVHFLLTLANSSGLTVVHHRAAVMSTFLLDISNDPVKDCESNYFFDSFAFEKSYLTYKISKKLTVPSR